jgi:magnesium transporter
MDVETSIQKLDSFISSEDTSSLTPTSIAKKLKKIKEVDQALFDEYIKKLPKEIVGEVILELPENYTAHLIDILEISEFKQIIEELESDDATDLVQHIEEVSEEKAQEVLETLEKEDKEDIEKLKKYDESQAGAYMQTEVFHASYDEKIQDSIDRLRALKENNELENIHQIYVTGPYGKLLFNIPLEDLILSDFTKTFKQSYATYEESFKPLYVLDTDSTEKILTYFDEHDLSVLPVVDYDGKLLGRITNDDIYDLVEETATEQIYNLAGVKEEVEDEDSLFDISKSRTFWLGLNLLTAIAASLVIGLFDSTIAKYIPLAVLMPIVASMGGNAGTQTLTVVVRQLALGDIDFSNAFSAVKKEVILSLVNGLIFSLLMGLIAYFWFSQSMLGLVIAIAMTINLFAAGFFGSIIPLMLKRFGADPAVGSTVLLTTVTDVVGFLSFLGLAKIML